MRLVLASSSPRRADLLRESGISFRVETPGVEEWSAEDFPEVQPGELARGNARRKARAVAGRKPGLAVLAADTIVVCQGKILGKPVDEEMARQMLASLSGRIHEVVTAVVLVLPDGKKIRESVVRTRVKFRDLSPKEVDDYVRSTDVLDKAGAYALQEGGDRIVERVEGSRSNVIGLPMEIVLPWCEELDPGAD